MMVIRVLTFHPMFFNVWMRGLYLLDFSLMVVLGESVMVISRFYELYGV